MILLYDRKRACILIGTLIMIVILISVSSYALKNDPQPELFSLTRDKLVITFDLPTNTVETPIEYAQDENLTSIPSYKFTVKNLENGANYYDIIIDITNIPDQSLIPYIKIQLDKEEPIYLSETKKSNSYHIFTNKLNSKVANTHELKIYLSNKDKTGNELQQINPFDIIFNIDITPTTYTPTFTESIQNLLKDSTELYQDEHGNIRYYGQDPKNYVLFNNELWRAIGIIKTNTEEGEKKLIKLVRNESIAITSFDYQSSNNYTNNFNNSTLKTILNENGYWNRAQVSCPHRTDRNATCDFSTNGLQEQSKNQIVKIIYSVGGWHTNAVSPSSMFLKEKQVTQDKQTAYVTILSPSDYGGSAGPAYQNVYFNTFAKSSTKTNYLYTGETEWLISPNTDDYEKSFSITTDGNITLDDKVSNAKTIRPCIYLNNRLNIKTGDGSKEKPYQIEFLED